MFIGRAKELQELNSLRQRRAGGIAVVYGRRRVGKSRLIKEFIKDKSSYFFEGIEGEKTVGQLARFGQQLQLQLGGIGDVSFSSWNAALSFLTKTLLKPGDILVLDELQWLAARRSNLIGLLKFYWDNYWKSKQIILILCGSVASFMINKVLNSKALYGRISSELLVGKLEPQEAQKLLGQRSALEKIQYLMLLGGVPKYLEEVQRNRSFDQNMSRLCFQHNSIMLREFERIFYSQFNEAQGYQTVVKILAEAPRTQKELSLLSEIPSGGGLKHYLTGLERAEFIQALPPFGKSRNSKFTRYIVTDEFLRLYFKFIRPNLENITLSKNQNFFIKRIKANWSTWLGLAFERYCFNHALRLAECMGFLEEVESVRTISQKPQKGSRGFQVDIVYTRFDNVVVVGEVKFYLAPLSTPIIPEMEQKIRHINIPSGYSLEKALICHTPPTKALVESCYFDHVVTTEQILYD